MMKLIAATGVLAVAVSVALAGGTAVKSGPQVGDKVPGPFHPLNINGEKAGQKHCLYCQHGTSPVAMIFAREVTPELTKLIKKIDEATAKNRTANMGSFVVFLSDSEALGDQLKEVANKENIKTCVLSIDNPAGLKGYNFARDAAVTVVLYEDHTVRANHSFRKGQLNEQAINRIVADIPKIVNPN
jgi:hypothetical protein